MSLPPDLTVWPRRRFAWFTDAFVYDGKTAWLVVGLLLAINAIVLANAILHDPRYGYDAPAHLDYVRTLGAGRLPGEADSHEFFSPPLPYVPGALLWATLDASGRDGRAELALKLAQLIQVGYSFVLTFVLLKIARLVRAGPLVPACALLCLGLVPTYYRTFAMVRGEPLLATLTLLGTYLTIRTFALRVPMLGAAALLGVTLGLSVISRQWAFFLLPALGLLGLWRVIVDRVHRAATLRAGVVVIVAFAVVGAPFYVHLHRAYGSIRAFNRPPAEEPIPDVPARSASEVAQLLATRPIRDAFAAHPFVLFYADVWGDYWQYFLVYAKTKSGRLLKPVEISRNMNQGRGKSNYATMPAYLGRLAIAGAIPTTLAIVGCAAGVIAVRRVRRDEPLSVVLPTLALTVLGTAAGYVWFVATYPNEEGDTIKASYPLQIYAPLAILAAAVVGHLNAKSPRAARAILVVLLLIAIHNLPATITRYR